MAKKTRRQPTGENKQKANQDSTNIPVTLNENLERSSDEMYKAQEVFVIDRTNNTTELPKTIPPSTNCVDNVEVNESESDSESESETELTLKLPISKSGDYALSSELHVGPLPKLYVNFDISKPSKGNTVIPSKLKDNSQHEQLMKKSVLTPGIEKADVIPPYEESVRQLKKKRQAERDKTKGKNWFDMQAPEMTEEKKNDLMVLHMRRALNPKQFYKAPDLKALPKFFQVGQVVDNPADFYHSRIPKKQRKKTLVDELLEDAEFRKFNKRKYEEIQETKAKRRGPYRHMKRMKKNKK